MTKQQAKVNKAAWRKALLEGRVVRHNDSYDEALDWIDLYAKTREFRLRLR